MCEGEVKALSDLVAPGEGSTVEFKRSLRSDLGREICAFANAAGGVILIGVDDDGSVRGVEGHNRLKSKVQSVARSADPSIGVEIASIGDVLAVRVPRQRIFGGQNHGRESANYLQGCTICVSCRWTGHYRTVPHKRENGLDWREAMRATDRSSPVGSMRNLAPSGDAIRLCGSHICN